MKSPQEALEFLGLTAVASIEEIDRAARDRVESLSESDESHRVLVAARVSKARRIALSANRAEQKKPRTQPLVGIQSGDGTDDESTARRSVSNRTPSSVPDLSLTKQADLPFNQPLLRTARAGVMSDTDRGPGMTVPQLTEGRVLADRYEIRRQIGQGGMGAVFEAFDRTRNEPVAIKVLLPHLLQDPAACERFSNEARIASQLAHPGIVRVYDLQQADGLTFLTMELLQGRNLRDEIDDRRQRNRRFRVDEIKHIAEQLCDALSHAHEYTVHRDVKPENIWLCEDGTVKLMDFGIARLMGPGRFATTGLQMGTAYYMAPEQLKGQESVEASADQYSVAVVLYELLTGDLPQGVVRSPHQLRKSIPQRMSQAVMKSLEADPAARHSDIAALWSGLNQQRHRWSRWALAAALLLAVGVGSTAPIWVPGIAVWWKQKTAGPIIDRAKSSEQQAERSLKAWSGLAPSIPESAYPDEVAAGKQRLNSGRNAFAESEFEAAEAEFLQAREQFDTAVKKANAWLQAKIGRDRQRATDRVQRAESLPSLLESRLKAAQSDVAKWQGRAQNDPEFRAAKIARQSVSKLLDQFKKNEAVQSAIRRARFKLDAGEAGLRNDPAEAGSQFSAAIKQADIALGWYSRTLDDEKHARKEVQKQVGAIVTKAKLESKAGRWKNAHGLLSSAIQRDPLNASHYSQRSAVALERWNLAAALADSSTAVRLQPTAPHHHLLSRVLFAREQPVKALQEIDRAIQLDRQLATLHVMRGRILSQLGRPADALAAFDAALDCDSACMPALLHRGWLHASQYRYAAATDDFIAVIAKKADDGDALFHIASARFGLARASDANAVHAALSAIKAARKKAPHRIRFAILQMRILRWKGDRQSAIALGNDLIKRHPKHPAIYAEIGHALSELNKHTDAIRSFGRAISLTRNTGRYYVWRAGQYCITGQFEQALADCRTAEKLEPSVSAIANVERARCYLAMKSRADEALAAANTAINTAPNLADAYVQRGLIQIANDSRPKGLADLDRAAQLDARSILAIRTRIRHLPSDKQRAEYSRLIELRPIAAHYIQRAEYHRRRSSSKTPEVLKAALADYRKAIELEPGNAAHYAKRAYAYRWHASDKTRAAKDYEAAVRLAPNNLSYSYSLASLYRSMKKYDQAFDTLDKAVRNNPRRDAAFYNRARAYRWAGTGRENANKAIADCSRAYELNPQNFSAVYLRFRINLAEGNHTAARSDMRKAYRLKPDSYSWKYVISSTIHSAVFGKSWGSQRKPTMTFAEGMKYADALVSLDYNRLRFRQQRIALYAKQGDTDKVLTEISSALAITFERDTSNKHYSEKMRKSLYDSGTVKLLARRAGIYMDKKDYDLAISDYSQIIKTQPSRYYYQTRAELYRKREDYRRSVADFTEAIKLEMGSRYKSKRTLAYLYNQRGLAHSSLKQYDHSISDFRKAAGFAPDAAVYENNLGYAYFGAKQYSKSYSAYSSALKKAKKDFDKGRANSGMGKVYLKAWKSYSSTARYYTKAINAFQNANLKDDHKWRLAAAYTSRGNAYLERKMYSSAISDYSTALRIAKSNTRKALCYNQRGVCYSFLKQRYSALTDYSNAIRTNPLPIYYRNRAICYKNLRLNSKAAEDEAEAKRLERSR